jgi:hypothetical protein
VIVNIFVPVMEVPGTKAAGPVKKDPSDPAH